MTSRWFVVCLVALMAAAPSLAQAEEPLAEEAPLPDEATPAQPKPAKAQKDSKDAKKAKADKPVEIGGMLQLRTFAGPAPENSGKEDARWERSFQVTRARVDFAAKVVGWKAKTKIAFDKGVFRVLNAYAQRDLPAGLEFTAGQFKQIYSRTYLISADETHTYERPEVIDLFGGSRDIGAALAGSWLHQRVEATVAAYNGNGASVKEDDNPEIRLEARVDIAPLGRYDLDSYPIGKEARTRLGVGMMREKTKNARNIGGLKLDDQVTQWSGFLAARALGLELRSEAFWAERAPVDVPATDNQGQPLEIASSVWKGAYAELAADLPFVPGLQLAGMSELAIPSDDLRAGRTTTWTAAANYYIDGDRLKVQGAWKHEAVDKADGSQQTRWKAYLQLQVGY